MTLAIQISPADGIAGTSDQGLDAGEILACYGIRVASTFVVSTGTAAVAAAGELGFPVVLKSAKPDLVHKTDVGSVRLGLRDADAGGGAYNAIAELDLNPVIVNADGLDVVDVKLRLEAVGDEPDASLRALREPR